MQDITANGVKTQQNIELLFCAGSLKRNKKGDRGYLLWRKRGSELRVLWCPDLFTALALNALAAQGIMPIEDGFPLITTWAKMTALGGKIR